MLCVSHSKMDGSHGRFPGGGDLSWSADSWFGSVKGRKRNIRHSVRLQPETGEQEQKSLSLDEKAGLRQTNISCCAKETGVYLKGNREPRRNSFKEGVDLICILGRSLLLQWGLDGAKDGGREISGCYRL